MRERVQVGMHASIAGGLSKAVDRAVETASDCFQIFARNPRGWFARPLELDEISEFRMARRMLVCGRLRFTPFTSSILQPRIRCCWPGHGTPLRRLVRSRAIGADYLVVHPGSAGRADVERGMATAVESIRECVRGLRLNGAPPNASRAGRNGAMSILIENTAGQGSSIGWSFEQLAWLLRELDDVPVDVCLDTAHTYASATTFRPKRDCDRRFELSMVRSGSIG